MQHGAATAKSLWQYVWGSRQVSGCRSAKIPTSEAQDNTQNTFLNVLEAAPVMRSSLGRIFKSVQGENGRFAIALQRTRYSGHHFSRLMRDASNKRRRERPAYSMGRADKGQGYRGYWDYHCGLTRVIGGFIWITVRDMGNNEPLLLSA